MLTNGWFRKQFDSFVGDITQMGSYFFGLNENEDIPNWGIKGRHIAILVLKSRTIQTRLVRKNFNVQKRNAQISKKV